MIKACQSPLKIALICCISVVFISGCASEQYLPRPLNAQQSLAQIQEKSPNSEAFKTYLSKHGYAKQALPLQTWGLNELTLCALFYHPKLDFAKAQYALANHNITAAGVRANPAVTGQLSHSNRANGDISPWLYGLQIEVPIEINHKREIRVEEAEQLAEASRMDFAETAWQLRQAIAADLLQLHENAIAIESLTKQLGTYQKISAMLEKRLKHGLNDSTTLTNSQLTAQILASELEKHRSQTMMIRAKLATDTGLTAEQFAPIVLLPFNLDAALQTQTTYVNQLHQDKIMQAQTLLNRIDIRRSLAKYAAAEAKVKLEIAKQVPDLSLSPGYAFEFGDRVWSLGINTLLNLANKNETMIAEAKLLRDIEAKQFTVLQSDIIGQMAQAQLEYTAALQSLNKQTTLYDAQTQQVAQQAAQLEAGLLDRLALTQTQLLQQNALQQLQTAQFAVLQAALKLENLMHKPFEAASIQVNELTP